MATWVVHGVLTRVIDGDTVVADLDLGWHVGLNNQSIRLYGINAPELHDKDPAVRAAARVAKEALKQYEGASITVTSHVLDKYGRVLAMVDVDGVDLSQLQLANDRAAVYLP